MQLFTARLRSQLRDRFWKLHTRLATFRLSNCSRGVKTFCVSASGRCQRPRQRQTVPPSHKVFTRAPKLPCIRRLLTPTLPRKPQTRGTTPSMQPRTRSSLALLAHYSERGKHGEIHAARHGRSMDTTLAVVVCLSPELGRHRHGGVRYLTPCLIALLDIPSAILSGPPMRFVHGPYPNSPSHFLT